MVAWKGPPDLVEKKRLSHPIEWSIKKSTREGIRSCKVATFGALHIELDKDVVSSFSERMVFGPRNT